MEFIDITRTVDPKMMKWLYDTEPPSQEFVTRTDNRDPATVSEWKMSSHTGTHMDARVHFIPGGWTMEALDLSRSVGLCRVVDLTHVEEQAGRADLEAAEVAGQVRLLLKTRNSDGKLMQREEFEECYSAISRKAAEYLIEIGVETIGVDYLSIKPFEDGEFSTPTARYSGQTW